EVVDPDDDVVDPGDAVVHRCPPWLRCDDTRRRAGAPSPEQAGAGAFVRSRFALGVGAGKTTPPGMPARRTGGREAMEGLLGIAVLLLLAWTISEDRFHVPVRVVVAGVLLQFAIAVVLLKFPPASKAFLLLNDGVEALQKATDAGTGFVFGYLGGGPLPFSENKPGAAFIFAFRALPLVLVISALATLLFYWGVLQRIVQAFAWVLRRSVGVGGPLGLGAAVHIFVGHIEAPLLIRPYLMRLERGEL